jgi:hypothetical protein
VPPASDRLWSSIPLLTDAGLSRLTSSTRLIFVSYARQDGAGWCRAFKTMLSPLGDDDLAVWSDHEITVGTAWRPELETAIQRADAALVLVSPGLLASPFVRDEELPALIRRRIPIAYAHVEASMALELKHFADVQWAHDPANALSDLPGANREIVRICARVIDLLPTRDSRSRSSSADATVTARNHRPELTTTAAPGELFGVPPPPPEEVPRSEFDAVCRALREAGEGTVGITGQALGIHGQGGIGKTVLAASVARDPATRQHFPDGIHWVTAGQDADVVSLQLDLLERLGVEPPAVRSVAAAAEALREALEDRRCLIVVDDVWSASTAIAFSVAGPRGRVLLTTRHVSVLEAVHASVQNLGRLDDPAARMLLAKLTD